MPPLAILLATRLPTSLRRHLTPARLALLQQFITFGLVGFAGLGVSLACVYVLRQWVNLYEAGALAYLAAVTTTWALNRTITFRGHVSFVPMWRQWVSFFGVSMAGFILNYGAYALLIANFEEVAARPVIAVCAGAVAGMFSNFFLSRRVVFR